MTTLELLKKAKAASSEAHFTTHQKDEALLKMADALVAATDAILEANRQDMESAKSHISQVMLDRKPDSGHGRGHPPGGGAAGSCGRGSF